jgi:predicted adenine nucleotide alpha hydrolase (AANH) superfamily ATPase
MENIKDYKILLLSCCAPCSCAVINKLRLDGANFTVAFYNPNIFPEAEYIKRRDEQKKLCQEWNIDFIELEYNHHDWLQMALPYKDEPERGKRCSLCFEFRLKRVMEYAKENGYDCVASVLGVSRYKDLKQVNQSAYNASIATNVQYLEIESRKNGMQETRTLLIKSLNLYNQKYCGCPFSMRKED